MRASRCQAKHRDADSPFEGNRMDYHSARWCNLLPVFLGIKFKKIPTNEDVRIKTAASNLESIVSNETRRMIRGFDGESAYVLLTKCGAQLDDGVDPRYGECNGTGGISRVALSRLYKRQHDVRRAAAIPRTLLARWRAGIISISIIRRQNVSTCVRR